MSNAYLAATDPTTAWAQDAVDGKFVVGDIVQASAERHLRDIRESEVDHINTALDTAGAPKVSQGQANLQTNAIPEDYWPMLSKIESNDRPYVKASTSSASGLYQFIKSTWIGEGGKWGADSSQAFGGLKPTPAEQLQRAKTFTAKNAAILKANGIAINKASLYAAHFFGPGTASKVIAAKTTARADLIAGPAATKANPSILQNKTVGQFLTWLHKKTGVWAR